ncbi:MAG TPA: RluA family pseudouridine synthase [Burkholderiaceae bacterium]|nr:RluA family pseudouridine synthase [Burkholderiaceae bacterium]
MTRPAPAAPFPENDDDPLVKADTAEARLFTVAANATGTRIDKLLASLLPDVSRSRIKQWIEAGAVRVNGTAPQADDAAIGGDTIAVTPLPAADALAFRPEPLSLEVVYEDGAILVLDKPPGLVVHPGAGNWSGTLLNGLLAYDARLAEVPRAGIVHRLDAETSGLMVVARTAPAQLDLVRQLQARSVTREYWAVVSGTPGPALTIDTPIARDPRNPLRFRTGASLKGKPARTHVRTVALADRVPRVAWVACRLETGRTHQIRVHLESIGHPLVGDPVYRRGRPAIPAADAFERQALHACRLSLVHPVSGERLSWFRPPPADLRTLMENLGWDASTFVNVFHDFEKSAS